jgi:hypothetical protein
MNEVNFVGFLRCYQAVEVSYKRIANIPVSDYFMCE